MEICSTSLINEGEPKLVFKDIKFKELIGDVFVSLEKNDDQVKTFPGHRVFTVLSNLRNSTPCRFTLLPHQHQSRKFLRNFTNFSMMSIEHLKEKQENRKIEKTRNRVIKDREE